MMNASVGWSLLDFGPHVEFENGSEDPLPTTTRGGLALDFRSAYELARRRLFGASLYGALSKLMVRLPHCDTPPDCDADGAFAALFTSWMPIEVIVGAVNDANAERVSLSAFDQMIKHAGIELSLMRNLDVRWGTFQEQIISVCVRTIC